MRGFNVTPDFARAWIAVLGLLGWCAGQVDRGIWVPSANNVHELTRSGVLANTYPTTCTGSFTPCRFSLARDGLGNVYVGREFTLLPGVGGSMQAYRGGAGLTAQWPVPATDVVCDRQNVVWFVAPGTGPTQTVDHITVYRATAGLGMSTGSTFLPQVWGKLAVHPANGVWLAAGNTVRRISPAMVQGPVLTLGAAVNAIAADRQGRLWVSHGGGAIDRVVESPGGTLSVDVSIPFANVESLHVDLCGIIHVHVQGATSSLYRFTPDGIGLPAVHFGLRFKAAGLGTGGGYWFLLETSAAGLNVFSFTNAGPTVQFLEPTSPGPFGGSFFQGDLTGAEWCTVAPAQDDSDLDGAPNLEEALRGTDMLVPASRPPTLSRVSVSGPPSQWILTYSDPDPMHAGLVYQLACSLGVATGFPAGLGGICPIVPLDIDDVFLASLTPSAIFSGFGGILDAQGAASATLTFPAWTPPGIPLHVAGVTFSPALGAIVATTAGLSGITP